MYPEGAEANESGDQAARLALQNAFSQRLNLLLDQLAAPGQGRGRIEAAATCLGIPVSTAQRLLSGSVLPEAHRLARIAERLGVTTDYLLGSATLEEAQRNIRERRGEAVPVSELRYVTIPILNPDPGLQGDAYFHVPRAYLTRFIEPVESAALIVMRGDSMEPTVLSGELLFIASMPHLGEASLPEGLYPMRWRGGGEWTVRRLQAAGRDYLVSCDNPRYAPAKVRREALSEDGDYDWVVGGRLRTIFKRY